MTAVSPVIVRAGFLPLLDSAILITARERGFASEESIDLRLFRETSWANIRDRVSVGQFDVAHMLAPLPIAANLGLSPLNVPLVAPMALGLGGNAITLSAVLWDELEKEGATADGDPARAGRALKQLIVARKSRGAPPLIFAVVHSFSGHHYELRYWLAACGIDPARDVTITIVPPPLMADALKAGRVDGYCVGEPWNSLAVLEGHGRIVTTKSAIWRSSPEKVLGMRKEWAEANGDILSRLLQALHRASLWCEDKANADELVGILAREEYLDLPESVLRPGITGTISLGSGEARRIPDFLIFSRKAATFPWQSHALWFYSQMVRWGQVPMSEQAIVAARASYRPDLYRMALKPAGAALPGASSKIEGALKEETYMPAAGGALALGPDGFFDGIVFDPDRIEAYLDGLR